MGCGVLRIQWYRAIAYLAGVSQAVCTPLANMAHATGAAELRQIAGTVYIERADGYRLASAGMPVYLGQRILIPNGASAVLVLRPGCAFRLLQNSMIKLSAGATCNDSIVTLAGVFLAQAIGLDDLDTVNDTARSGLGAIGSESLESGSEAEFEPEVEPLSRSRAIPLPDAVDPSISAIGGSETPATTTAAEKAEVQARIARVEETATVFDTVDNVSAETGLFSGAGLTLSAVAGGLALAALAASGTSPTAASAPSPPFSNLSPE